MRRIVALLTATALTLAVSGCGRGSAEAPADEDHGTAVVYTTPLEGEWELNTADAEPLVTDKQQELFDEATSTWENVRYEPLVLIAEQAGGGGSSSAFLCRGSRDEEEGINWYILVVFRNPKDEVRVSSIREINPAKLQLVEPTDSMVFGTWPAAELTGKEKLPGSVDEAFTIAVENSAYRLSPIMLLGTQHLEDGYNFVVMCAGDGDGVQNAVFVATVRVGQDGTTKLTSANVLAMTYYVSGQALVIETEEES